MQEVVYFSIWRDFASEHPDIGGSWHYVGSAICMIFVGSISAAGVGITLTAAQKMVFAELDWTPANMLQAEDRIHRIGQTGNALIQQLVFDGSLDAKMAETLVRKMSVIEKALDIMNDEPVEIFEEELA